MEIKDLRIFEKVAYHGSISKAAKELCYVQSHVTARIQTLEKELQTPLFHRYSRGMRLTPEGKKLLSYTNNFLSMMDQMVKVIQDTDHPSGKLELGTVDTVIKLPNILSSYHKKYQNVDLSLVTGVTEQLVEDVVNHKLDGAFVTGFDDHPKIIQHEVFREQLTLVTNSETLTFEELLNKPLLVFKSGCSYRAKLEKWLQDEGISKAKMMEFGTLETILGSVVAGLGVTLIPCSTVRHLEKDGVVRCITIPEKYRHVSTVFIRRADAYMTNAMQKFIETINTTVETNITDPLRYRYQ